MSNKGITAETQVRIALNRANSLHPKLHGQEGKVNTVSRSGRTCVELPDGTKHNVHASALEATA